MKHPAWHGLCFSWARPMDSFLQHLTVWMIGGFATGWLVSLYQAMRSDADPR